MGLYSILKFLAIRSIELLVIVMLIVFIPHIPPEASFSRSFRVPPSKPLEGKLALNHKLDDVEIWHKGDLLGPEAFVDYNNQLYTSLHGGDIVKLTGNHITPVVKFGKPCKGIYQEQICGRPLGMNFDSNGNLYACDSYYGVYRVDVTTGEKIQLISLNQNIEGVKPKLPNSIAVASNGDLYWTDSSTEFQLYDGIFDMLADGSGRLIHYNAKTKKNTVLIKNLHFANGVALSNDEEFVIVAETANNRIHRYYLKGPKKGTHDIFIDGLPGFPDNLKALGKDGFLIPLVVAVDKDHPQISQVLSEFPLIRKFLARVLGLVELGFKLIHRAYPMEFTERAVHMIGHFTMMSFMYPKRTTILHVSKSGEILDCLHTENKKITGISEAHIYKDTLLLGSPFNDYIARIPLANVGWQHLARKEATTTTSTTTTTTTTTTPKPTTTTTTPRPTTTTTTTPRPTTTTPPPTTTTTTQRPTTTTTTPRPTTTTTTPKPTTTTTQRPTTTTTTPKPTTTTPKPTTQAPPTKPATAVPTTAKQPPQKPQQNPKTAQPTTAPPKTKN